MIYTIEITEEAIKDLQYLDKSAQVIILDKIESQLTYQPSQITRNRKPLKENSLFQWELRIDNYRVFYTIEEKIVIVTVVAIGYKKHNNLYIRNKQINL